MRDFFIRLFTPLARHMGKVHPDILTFISLSAGIVAGISFAATQTSTWFYLAGGCLLAISGAADSLDGIVARMYGHTSRKGNFLDHFCDRLVDIAILSGLAFSLDASPVFGLFLALLVLLNSYLGTQIEATLGKRSYAGTGKAEFFVGFILFSILALIFPGRIVELSGLEVALVDIFMSVVFLATLASLARRFRIGLQGSVEQDLREGRQR